MSVRFARLFCLALVGVCFSTAATAATKSGSLVWRGDDATANAVMNEVGKAWPQAGHGRIERIDEIVHEQAAARVEPGGAGGRQPSPPHRTVIVVDQPEPLQIGGRVQPV